MQLIISQEGKVSCIYGEAIELASLGPLQITRASHVEPDQHGQWWADMAPVHGPKLGPFKKRSDHFLNVQNRRRLASTSSTRHHRFLPLVHQLGITKHVHRVDELIKQPVWLVTPKAMQEQHPTLGGVLESIRGS